MASSAWLFVRIVLVGAALLTVYLNLIAPKTHRAWNPLRWPRIIARDIGPQSIWLIPLFVLLVLHMINLNVVDPWMREKVLATGFRPVDWILAIEGDAVHSLRALHGPVQDFLFTWFYLVFHHALLVGMPIYFLTSAEPVLGRRLLVSVLAVFIFALPGFLFFPADNPHIHFGDPLVLEQVIAGVTPVYYSGTSIDNTFPSLHIGFATLLVLHGLGSANKRLKWSLAAYGPLLVFSTVYLQVHWLVDIAGGILVGAAAWAVGRWFVRRVESKNAMRT